MRLRTTLCGLVLGMALAAQEPARRQAIPLKPVTEDYRDYSDWKHMDSATYFRLRRMHEFGLPADEAFEQEVARAVYYLDAVKVPDWDAILSPNDASKPLTPTLTFSGDSTNHLPNVFNDEAGYFYFRNGSSHLFAQDSSDIHALVDYHIGLRERGLWSGLSPYDTVLRFTVVGLADKNPFSGQEDLVSDQMNYELSAMRSLAIGGVIRAYCPKAEVEIRAFGNTRQVRRGEDSCAFAHNRVAYVLPGMTAVEHGLLNIKVDYVVGDASYSMVKDNGAGYPPLEIVMLFPYENGNVFLFSDRGYVFDDERRRYVYNHISPNDAPVLLTDYRPLPEAQTPLYQVMLYLSLVADPGTSFGFITDGNASWSLVQAQHVISAATKNDVSLSIIGTGEYDQRYEPLLRIVSSTRGQSFFACEAKGVPRVPGFALLRAP